MTCNNEYTPYELAMKLLIEYPFDGIAESIVILMNYSGI